MSTKKRKLNESKKDFGKGGAWKQELMIMVKEECNVKIDWDIAGVIFDYSVGWWEPCNGCNEMIDPSFSKCEYRWDRGNGISINHYCKDCDSNSGNGWKMSKYVFTDDMI